MKSLPGAGASGPRQGSAVSQEGSVFGNYRNRLVPVGLLSLAAGLILHNWLHSRPAEFASGFLIGMSLVFLLASFWVRKRAC